MHAFMINDRSKCKVLSVLALVGIGVIAPHGVRGSPPALPPPTPSDRTHLGPPPLPMAH